MASDNFHFKIPEDNIRNEQYEKTGGGETFQRNDHASHGQKLIQETIKIRDFEAQRKDYRLTSDIFLQIETPKEISIKDARPKVENLGFEVINYSKANESFGTVRISKARFNELEERLVNYANSSEHIGKSYFSVIEDLSSVPVESKIKTVINADDSEVPIVLSLYNVLSQREKFIINQALIQELQKHTSEIEQHTFENGITSIACTIKPSIISSIASEFSTIKEIRSNYAFVVENSTNIAALPNPLKIDPPESNSVICIIDSGVKNAGRIFDNLLAHVEKKLPSGAVDATYDHGTFVASRCVFGDDLDACLGTHKLSPYCKILDVQVFGVDATGKKVPTLEHKLRIVIEEIVKKYSKTTKVYNLSLGAEDPIKDHEFSDLAKLLDYLSKTYQVLFIISAGNINQLLGLYPTDHFKNPLSRISSPAESLLSITVGSLAKYSDGNSIAQKDELSPFSRIGPGADKGIKPELLAHGGNLIRVYDKAPRVSTYGISSDGKNLAVDVGTSHAAPLISLAAQRLFDLYPNSNPSLVKALLCHFTKPKSVRTGLIDDGYQYCGFGEPSIQDTMVASGNNAVFIYEGRLNQENYQFVGFHVPSSFGTNKDAKLKIRITLTYDPPVNPDNEAEYSQSRIAVLLHKRTEFGTKGITITDEKYQVPWNPIIKFEKTFSRNYLAGLWELRLRLFTRGPISDQYKQDYALVIEIIDENNKIDVYADIMKDYKDIYKKIPVRVAA
ncbi:S8 family peptidase [Fulvivirgaceae bacterium PWU4]|uniref:S8 family peptidase n=1 Tax=Chryseosolibacter histidini TaxID=2782349 RepID=A0AAP2DKF0_9BACT|nr:S8 family peptidase [Chryseosolibacter histidini]MBT1697144.1 S8 family peptidase [Chryseosolibacter histidini]